MDTERMRVGVCAAAVILVLGSPTTEGEEGIRYGLPETPWPETMGNHRARVQVSEKAPAVWVRIPWRRRDLHPQDKNIVIVDATTGKTIRNIARIAVNREFGDLAFQPETAPGDYFVYYMPFVASPVPHAYVTQYAAPQSTADPAWLERHALTPERLAQNAWQALPKAKVLEIQARSEFHTFEPMEVIATAQETKDLLAKHPNRAYLVFPENRRYPIRMTDDLPSRWIRSGVGDEFRGKAQRGEYYVFQIGVYAARQAVEDLSLEFTDLKPETGQAIPASAFDCFNVSGTDWLGRPIRKTVTVPSGKVGALWLGVQIPRDAAVGEHRATVTLRPKNAQPTAVKILVTVSDKMLDDGGDADLWRLARLRWLNSTLGLDDEPVAPYTPLKVDGRTVSCLGRRLRFGGTGLPESIQSTFLKTGLLGAPDVPAQEILARPMVLLVETAAGQVIPWTGGEPKVVRTAPAIAGWESRSRGGPLGMTCSATMEADGYVNYALTIKAEQALDVTDIRLEIPLRPEVAAYMMGLGRKGGYRPKEWKWTWDAKRANNTVWIGQTHAGLYCKLKGPQDTWDIYQLTAGAPPSWSNDGKGGCTVTEDGQGAVVVRAYSGPRSLRTGDELLFRFGLLITPVKPLDPEHWNQRYYHAHVSPDTAVRSGANIINIHHGNELNPNINYPFLAADKLAAYVKDAHDKGVKVKIYYTVRELSNYAAELWALRSLGFEVFTDGPGGGHSWLQEHLVSNYAPAWHHTLGNGQVDAAIATTGLSRWHNYYLEGLAWLLKNVQIDGLYLDGIGYDREIMKRVRKIMDRTRPGCLIDFHSGNEFTYADMRLSPACKYMEHFPYLNSLWFGEMYDYNETPDYWLVEVSGIPFGLFGEMLEGNGNPWRGMVYGMTARYYSGADPKPIWKLWDDFGIREAAMIGYWTGSCPVKTDHPDVLATAYVKKDKVLVSLASWSGQAVRTKLTVDWKALGLNPSKAALYAPPIPAFQPGALFKPTDEIPVHPGRGWLLILDEQRHELPVSPDAYQSRRLLLEDRFDGDRLGGDWKTELSKQPNTRLEAKQGAMTIQAMANCAAFAERPLPPGTTLVECRVFSGTDDGASWGPGLCLVWPQKVLRINVRSEGRFGADDGATQAFGGLSAKNTWYRLRIRLEDKEVLAEVSGDGTFWETLLSVPRNQFPGDPVAVRLGKMTPGGKNEDFSPVGAAGSCALDDLRVFGKAGE